MTTPTRGRDRARAALGTAGLVLGSLLACALFLEVALRIAPELLGARAANQIFSVYHAKPGGIYFHEPITDLLYMRPDYQTHAWFNGYSWHHATDARGFRNPPGRPVDGALLLGDSLIYGHGVEEEDGVAAQLEKRHGRRVYNLSRQGDSLYPHYVMLRLHLDAFRPETVVLFVFHNDFHDLVAYRGIALLQETPEITFGDYARIREQLADRPTVPHAWSRRLRYRSVTYRLFLALRSRIQRGSWRTADDDPDTVAPLDRPLLDPEAQSVLASYYERTLGDLTSRCEAVGARLVVVYLDTFPDRRVGTREAKRFSREILKSAAEQHGFALFDTGDLLTECDACALPGDGHLTPEGHRLLADFVDEILGPPAPSEVGS